MKFLNVTGKQIKCIQNIIYFICFLKIVSALFFSEYVPKPFKHPAFGLILLGFSFFCHK